MDNIVVELTMTTDFIDTDSFSFSVHRSSEELIKMVSRC